VSKGNSLETDVLEIILQAVALANMWDNAASSPITNTHVSLHTADVGEGGSQTTNETSYGSYARVAVARTSGGWTVASGAAENVGAITFPQCSSGSATITHFAVGRDSSGAGYVFYKGALGASLAVSTGITPSFAAGALDITED
jgi:hypothetical protein